MMARKMCPKERVDHPIQNVKMQQRVKRKRKQGITDPRAKKIIPLIKMARVTSIRLTRRGKVGVKAMRRNGQRAERKDTNPTNLMRKENDLEAKSSQKKINIQNLIM